MFYSLFVGLSYHGSLYWSIFCGCHYVTALQTAKIWFLSIYRAKMCYFCRAIQPK